MARNALVFALSLLTFVGLAGAASADERHLHGDLVCDGKAAIAVVRFTISFNEERPVYRRLPAAVDGGLSADSGSDRTDCRLPDGKTVRLRIGVEQVFPYGLGGANPPSFFSLWIDKRKVLSKRVWKEGYGQDLPILVGLVIRSERLTFCDANEGSANVDCHDERLTLGSFQIDSVEYGGSTPKPGTMLLGRSRDPAFCRRYLEALGKSFEHLLGGGGDDTPFAPAIAWDESRWTDGALVTSAQVVPAPKSQPLRVMAFSGTWRFFEGDVYVFTPLSVSPADVEAFWKSGDPESIPARPRPAGWSVISGGVPDLYPQVSARYVHLRPQKIDGRLYVLAYPTYTKNRPTAVLLTVTPEPKAAPVCEFQRVEPNF